jgi:PAS domain S-box-containing protein
MLVGFVVVLLGVAIGVIPALVSTLRTLDEQQHRYDPTAQAVDDLLTGALNEETGLRGYALTGNATFLAPFDQGRRAVEHALAELRDQPVSPTIDADVRETEDALRDWRRYAGEVVSLGKGGDLAAAQELVATGGGKVRFDDFRAKQDRLSAAVATEVAANRRTLRRETERALIALVIALLVGFGLAAGLWAWWMARGRRNAQSERALADTGVLVQSAIDATPDPIFAKDRAGRHILANRARAASLTAGDPDVPMIGRTVDEFVDDELAARIRSDESAVMSTGAEVVLEESLRQPDGMHVFLTTKSPLYDAQGSVIGVVGVARDVTEERALLADRERLYQVEHRLATTLQLAMLGSSDADDDRVSICAAYRPAMEELAVGGDWYDVVTPPNGSIGLMVGDVVGRGINAATAMGQLRSALSALGYAERDPAAAIEALERFAVKLPDAHSATCLYALIDPAEESLTYSSAGHIPPLVIDPDGRAEFLDQHQDPPLVVAEGVRRQATVRSFPAGSTLVLCTDGLVERRGESIDAGLARLARAVTRDPGRPIEEMVDRVIEELLPGPEASDDVAVIAARLVRSAQPASPAPS